MECAVPDSWNVPTTLWTYQCAHLHRLPLLLSILGGIHRKFHFFVINLDTIHWMD